MFWHFFLSPLLPLFIVWHILILFYAVCGYESHVMCLVYQALKNNISIIPTCPEYSSHILPLRSVSRTPKSTPKRPHSTVTALCQLQWCVIAHALALFASERIREGRGRNRWRHATKVAEKIELHICLFVDVFMHVYCCAFTWLHSIGHSALQWQIYPAPFTVCTSCLPYAGCGDTCRRDDMPPEIRVIGNVVCECERAGRGKKIEELQEQQGQQGLKDMREAGKRWATVPESGTTQGEKGRW